MEGLTWPSVPQSQVRLRRRQIQSRVEVPPEARVLYVSGQVGVDSAGKLHDGIEAQSEQVWKNIGEVLEAGAWTSATSSSSPCS